MNPVFEFKSELWPWTANNGVSWFFVSVPQDESQDIKEIAPELGGFGSVKVEVTVGETVWQTSVFPSTEKECYILPIKKPVRKAEGIEEGDKVSVQLEILIS